MIFSQRIELIKNYVVVKSYLNKLIRKSASNEEIVDALNKQGKAKDKRNSKDYDPEQLAMGIKVEMEHTRDKALALKIAQDHLVEFPDYYTRLAEMEKEAKQEKENTKVPSIDDVIKFLKDNPNPNDDIVHAWSERNKYNNHKVEPIFYKLATKYVQSLKE